jgi:UDP-glucose 4-epimerase
MAVLVTGGTGYIGSVAVEVLRAAGERVVVLDDLFRGHRAALPEGVPLHEGNVGDRPLLRHLLSSYDFDACIHFAALTYVGESVEDPLRYYENNTAQTLVLLDELVRAGVHQVVFSSTAATYGEPQYSPLDEAHPQRPENPYGWGKLLVERALDACDQAHGMRFVALRYFNAAGATVDRGEDHEPESHLVPNVLFAALGKRDYLSVFGDQYPTPDGTPVRDYVHVADLGQAHALALNYLREGGSSQYINLGNGQGYSVLEVIETARQVTGRAIEARIEAPRAGDPSFLVAKADKAIEILGWQPQYGDLQSIVQSAWEWHLRHPDGYEG